MYALEFSDEAAKTIRKLPRNERDRILKKIQSIRDYPFAHLKKLEGNTFWRLHIGKYRAIVDVIVSGRRIIVLRIGKRGDVYDR